MAMEVKPASGKMNVLRLLIYVGLNPAAVAYAMTTLGSGMINNIFSFYYVKLFLNKYKISEGAFHQSQVSISFLRIAVLCIQMSINVRIDHNTITLLVVNSNMEMFWAAFHRLHHDDFIKL